jgi:hypothetical protein
VGWGEKKDNAANVQEQAAIKRIVIVEKSLQYEKTSMMLIASEISEGLIEKISIRI